MAALIPPNSVIAHVALLKAKPAAQWVFLGPFFVLELALIAVAVDPQQVYDAHYYADHQRAIDFIHTISVPVVLFAQVFLGLLTVWNTNFAARLRYSVATISDATHAHVRVHANRGSDEIVALTTNPKTGETMFKFQQSSWRYRGQTQQFAKPVYPVDRTFAEYASWTVDHPHDDPVQLSKDVELYGSNIVDIRVPEFHELLTDQVQAPFFVFQMFCVTLWLLDDYWMVALFNGFMMFMLECTVVMQRLKSMKSMREMGALPTTQVSVWRSGKWITVESTELVPRDVVILNSEGPAPADVVLVAGTCAVNEAMLTGESTPQMKSELPATAKPTTKLDIEEHSRHMVFSGTQVLSSTNDRHTASRAIGVVVQSGFETKQGNLIRTIIHSQSRVSQNSGEAFAFIGVLLVFACIASHYVMVRGLADPTKSRWKLFLTCTQIITNVVPPELPMQLALAVNTSLMALMRLRVFCTEPFRIPFAGKLDTCCFDKTGTLTTDEMLFAGVDLVATPEGSVKRSSIGGDVEIVLASCHSLVTLADKKTAGDAMEKASVDALGWVCPSSDAVERGLKAGAGSGTTAKRIDIVRRFPFDASLRRMSCVVTVHPPKGPAVTKIVVKGSPEAIARACSKVPEHTQHLADTYASRGLRVIALAARSLAPDESVESLTREQAESKLTLAGFALFDCPLKSDSKETISMLQGGLHRCVMITGDSIPTAVAVADAVGMADSKNGWIAAVGAKGGLVWRRYHVHANRDDEERSAPPATAAEGSAFVNAEALTDAVMHDVITRYSQVVAVWARCAPHHKESIVASMKAHGAHVLMAGDGTNDVGGLKQAHVGIAVLNGALVTASNEQLEKDKSDPSKPRPKPTTITSNMEEYINPMPPPLPPNAGIMDTIRHQMAVAKHQAETVHKKKLMENEQKQKIAQAASAAQTLTRAREATGVESMDAAAAMNSMFNDMDDGNAPMVKLGDASIAAPFTCRSKRMTAICDIVRLGRCTLVTTMQMYKVLALNCLVGAYTIAVLFTDGVKFSQTQTISSGLVAAVCFMCQSRSKPLDKLAPQRPINRVFHPYTITSIGLQFAVHLYSLSQTLAMVKNEDPEAMVNQRGEEEDDFRPTLLNSILFLMTTMTSAVTFAVNYQGHPFMTSLRDNRPMALCIGALAAGVIYCSLEIDMETNAMLDLVPFPNDAFKWEFFSILVIDVIGSFVAENGSRLLLGKLP